MSEKKKKLVAYHEAGHAILGALAKLTTVHQSSGDTLRHHILKVVISIVEVYLARLFVFKLRLSSLLMSNHVYVQFLFLFNIYRCVIGLFVDTVFVTQSDGNRAGTEPGNVRGLEGG